MIFRRRLLLAATALSALPAIGLAQNSGRHWLIGEWVGDRDINLGNRTGSARVLKVRSVNAAGTEANATWTTETNTFTVKLVVTGERVKFNTGRQGREGADYDLEHKGDQLIGTYDSGSSRPGKIALIKRQ